ncbi:hypothetical protein BLNAU_16439 [Blattamonas nauphoetae]|uniref:Uncharacterized protein n=1 Tax=Blattamonas nauphoetae TaxID=2049346 RepID=A0ABQ9XBB0_9EUKA|nr:hypothetical protein BLNAU_16439 [Blattamonas nauphoetae]
MSIQSKSSFKEGQLIMKNTKFDHPKNQVLLQCFCKVDRIPPIRSAVYRRFKDRVVPTHPKGGLFYPSFFPQAPKSLFNNILNPSPSAQATIEEIHFRSLLFPVVRNTIPRPRGCVVSFDASFSQELSYPTALPKDREWAGLDHPGMTLPPRHSQKLTFPILNQFINSRKVETNDTSKQAEKDLNKMNYFALADGLPCLRVKAMMEDINKAICPVDED